MPQVIEWTTYEPGKIVWKYPDENIKWGAQLIVKEMEVAVFFRDGEAKELGKSPGAGLGAGMMIIPPMFQQPVAGVPAAPLVICPKCNAQVPSTSRFCPNCGGAIAVPRTPAAKTKKCPKCGEEVAAGAKFCPSCGKKLKY